MSKRHWVIVVGLAVMLPGCISEVPDPQREPIPEAHRESPPPPGLTENPGLPQSPRPGQP